MIRLMLASDTHYGLDGKTNNKHVKFWKRVALAIKEDNIRAFIWAGDIASHKQRHLKRSIEMAREYIDIPILLVRGNHDLWQDVKDRKDITFTSIDAMYEWHEELFAQYDIHHLEKAPYIIDDVFICGFDGWYGMSNPPTNDKYWMPKVVGGSPIVNQYLSSRAWKEFERCLSYDTSKYRKSIIVTHHTPYPYDHALIDTAFSLYMDYGQHSASYKFLKEMKGKFDILCCGHSHKLRHDQREGLWIYNCGSDYNKPRFLAFEA